MSKIVGCKYCSKCGKAICITYYPFDMTVADELACLEEKHQKHLCNNCVYEFPTCDAHVIIFGECEGNDNVLECDNLKEAKSEKDG